MKRKFIVPALIALLIYFVGKEFLFPTSRKNEAALKYMRFEESANRVNLHKNSDTVHILDELCERNINGNTKTFGLNITNYVPCKWQEDFKSEKDGAVSAFYTSEDSGIIGMALFVNQLPFKISDNQIKKTFSIDEIKKTSQEVNAIDFKKSTLSGLDCMEVVYKKDSIDGRVLTAYTIHFETIFKNKYITLSYSAASQDKQQSKSLFYKYLPAFKDLSKKFTLK